MAVYFPSYEFKGKLRAMPLYWHHVCGNTSNYTGHFARWSDTAKPMLKDTWWRHQMKTFPRYCSSVREIHRSPVEFPSQEPVTWSFEFFFDLRFSKQLSKQSRRRWCGTPSRSLWWHCNAGKDSPKHTSIALFAVIIFTNRVDFISHEKSPCYSDQSAKWCFSRGSTVLQYLFRRKAKNSLSYWGRDKMAANFLTTFSNAFPWMEIYQFRLRFHWSLFPRVQLTILVQIMAWCRPGDKPLSGPIFVSLLTHICVTRPQWVIESSAVITRSNQSLNPQNTSHISPKAGELWNVFVWILTKIDRVKTAPHYSRLGSNSMSQLFRDFAAQTLSNA